MTDPRTPEDLQRIESLLRLHTNGQNPLLASPDWGPFVRASGYPLTDAQARDLNVATGTIAGRKTTTANNLLEMAGYRAEHLRATNKSKTANARKARAAKAGAK